VARNRVLAIVQAGGAGGRMDVLTRERAKPALPFAGVFQLVDLPLSNLAHSGISDVWLAVQFQGGSLEEQVANGRPWDLDRNRGGLRLLMPEQGSGPADQEGFATGNADLLFRVRDEIRAAGPEHVLVLSADHVYCFDYMDAVDAHRARSAECTLVTTEVSVGRAGDHATVEHGDDGLVTGFAYKPERPSTTTVAAEVIVYDPAVLVSVLEELHRELHDEADRDGDEEAGSGDSGLGDYGEHLVPRLVDRGRTYAFPMPGYWRDVGQPHLYLAAHRDVLTESVGVLDQPGWPILTRQLPHAPARVRTGAVVEDSLLSPGCEVAGVVRRSVLGPGAVVAAGAEVTGSVLFENVRVERGARVDQSVLDSGVVVEADARVGEQEGDAAADPDRVTLVGRDSRVGPGVRLAGGARLEPGTTA
jgi:glucose-1-phosphate adenylyltransferase